MISEQDKQAILKGAYGITREGNKVKFIGEREINNGFPYHFVILSQNDKILGSLGLTKNLTNQPEQESIHDVVGLWKDKPEPFDLERALLGEPVKLMDGVFGKGIQDIPNAQRDPLYKKVYSRWYNMLLRCYSANFHKNHPTYVNATMCEDWLTFSNFYYWLTSFDNWENLEIDKDLLSGNYYSPETCLLIPKNLNVFLAFSQKTNTNMIGVNYYTPKGRKEGIFRATISVKYKGKPSNKHLGHFSSPLEGHLAWLAAKIAQLDEYISVSEGNVKTTLQHLRAFMYNCLINKNEFCGLEHFRNNYSKLGMWKDEPEPVSNAVTVTLPRALKEPQDEMWFVDTEGYMKSGYGKCVSTEAFNRRVFFGSEEDAKAWFDAMQNSRK